MVSKLQGTTGTALGDAHHAANASISCMATGVGGISGEGSGLVGSSSQSQVNTYPAFNPTLMSEFSDPFITEVDASVPAIDPFVTPVSIPDAPIELSFPCTSLISPSHSSSTSSPSPTPPCVPLVTSDSLDTANVSSHQEEVHLANQISLELQDNQGIDQTVATAMIEAMPHYDQVLYSMQ
nr:hypothetical protein CFP56_32938 [Quercus suber]